MKELRRAQTGQALISVLLLVVVGSLVLTPALHLMSTGIQSGRTYEQKIADIYAADAGVEDAMWRIRYDTMDDLLGAGYDPYDYSTSYDYPYLLYVNGRNVTVTIQNVWVPKDIATPTPSEARQIIEDEKLLIMGYPDAAVSTYTIKIVYYWQGSSALNVKTIGVWLSSGYEYTEYSGSCSLQGQSFYRAPTVSVYKGGCAVVWNFTSQPLLSSFPGGTSGNPLVKTFTFKYSGPGGEIPELVGCWIDTTGVPGKSYHYSWDDTIRLYKILSQAGDIQIEAYGAKTKFRRLKSAVSGNYFGTGNTLLRGNLNPPDNYHYLLDRYSSATVATNEIDDTQGIPSDATIEAAYLYWTGWIDWNTYNPPDSGSQTRYPSGDISRGGTWDKTTDMYSYVDEVGAHDGDSSYLLHGTTSGHALFSFPAFNINVPSGEAIRGLTVSLVARDGCTGWFCSNNMRPRIRVGGYNYDGTSTEVSSDYGTISYTWTTNPRTGQPWTQDQINGIGTNALQGFGVSSDDANPQIRLTQVYATVYWGSSLRYPAGATQEALTTLVEQAARVNRVYFTGGSSADTLITADKWQTLYPASQFDGTVYEGTWFYTCKADVTDLLKQWIDSGAIASNGAGTYTVGHVAEPNQVDPSYSFSFASGGGSTGYPLGTPSPNPPSSNRYTAAHAGWSLLILYTSAQALNHQYYLYDIDTPGFNFFFGWKSSTVDWDNDGNPGGTVSGFLVPPQVPGETNAARITVFVGEGDKGYTGDYFKVNGSALVDGVSGYGTNNVWNGNSRGLPTDAGIDIDHFYVTWASQILRPMDVSALIEVPTGTDGFTMSYMLLQFRSLLGPGGVITNYAIRLT